MPKPEQQSATDPRGAAARLLEQWLRSRTPVDRLLESADAHRAFVTEVVYGAVRRHRTLEWLRSRLVEQAPRSRPDAFLLAGLYELFFMTGAEPYAVVNETVSAAKAAMGPRAAGFINAVLRRAAAERDRLRADLERQPPGVRFSHADLLVERWTRQFGADAARALCEWNNIPPDIVIRVNLAQTDARTYADRLREAAVTSTPHPYAPGQFLTLPHGVRVRELPGYAEGLFSVQDPSTLAAVRLLRPGPGERVLDACAAPGGKTGLIAQCMQNSGSLVAMDSSAERIALLRENVRRLRADFVTVVRGDATRAEQSLRDAGAASFDGVLVDAPCTNTGVIRRRPDARWRFSAEYLRKACVRQQAILRGVAPLVAPGGRLVYSTCSLEPEENARGVKAWLAGHPEFRLADAVQLLPPDSGTDGAYAARLERQP